MCSDWCSCRHCNKRLCPPALCSACLLNAPLIPSIAHSPCYLPLNHPQNYSVLVFSCVFSPSPRLCILSSVQTSSCIFPHLASSTHFINVLFTCACRSLATILNNWQFAQELLSLGAYDLFYFPSLRAAEVMGMGGHGKAWATSRDGTGGVLACASKSHTMLLPNSQSGPPLMGTVLKISCYPFSPLRSLVSDSVRLSIPSNAFSGNLFPASLYHKSLLFSCWELCQRSYRLIQPIV